MKFEKLSGPRLTLHQFGQGDITDDYIGWLNNPEVVRFSNQRFRTHDRASCEAYLKSFEKSDNLFIGIKQKADGRAIGTLTAFVNRQHGTADVGIMVGEAAVWGDGFGLEAWQLLTDWLLDIAGMRKVTAGTLACNIGMIRIAERSGMIEEGRRFAQEIVDGEPQDVVYFGRFAQ